MRKTAILILSILMVACQRNADRFTVCGNIMGAEGEKLFLERLTLSGTKTLDSLQLGADGEFEFRPAAPVHGYDFYQLRLKEKSIPFCVDSTETISFKSDYSVMPQTYVVEGSEQSLKLKELLELQRELAQEILSLYSTYRVERGIFEAKAQETLLIYKSRVKSEFIYPDPLSPCAYYALFMSVNGAPLFSPQTDRNDAKCYAAVATALDLKYPEWDRAVQLKRSALKSMKATAQARPLTDQVMEELSQKVTETGLIDIKLPDVNYVQRSLSELKGKVVLLDFTLYKSDYSANYTLLLRELYNKYADRGLAVYQVSLDSDEHYWLNSASTLPWVTVRDEAGAQSEYLKSYRVEALPTAFLINRENELVERLQNTEELEKSILKLLGD